jgi:hypothetical protein
MERRTHDRRSRWEPETVLPSQYWGHHRSPEVRLMAAVLEEALLSVTAPRSRRRWKEFSDAWTWISSDTRDWPFAFTNVCEALGFESAAVRARIARLVAGHGPKTARPPVAERPSGGAC